MNDNLQAVRLFNSVADGYDRKFSPMRIYDDTYDAFLALMPRGGKILDVACGPGNMTHYFIGKRPDLDAFGIDLAPNMVELARRNNPSGRFAVMDIRRLSELDDSFDGVACGFALPYFTASEAVALMKDAFDLLDQGGVAYFSAIEGPDGERLDVSSDGQHRLKVRTHSDATLSHWLILAGFGHVRFERVIYNGTHGSESHIIALATKT